MTPYQQEFNPLYLFSSAAQASFEGIIHTAWVFRIGNCNWEEVEALAVSYTIRIYIYSHSALQLI